MAFFNALPRRRFSARIHDFFLSNVLRVRADSDSSSASERRETDRGDKARHRVRLDSTLCEEDEMAPSNNFLRPSNLMLVSFSRYRRSTAMNF